MLFCILSAPCRSRAEFWRYRLDVAVPGNEILTYSFMSLLIFNVPCLHGTPTDEMSDALMAVRGFILKMLESMETASPNGRDYYTQGDGALKAAVRGHNACTSALTRLMDEVLWLAVPDIRIDDQSRVGDLTAAIPMVPEVTPTVHTNGSSAEFLKNSCVTVFRAAGAAEESLRLVVPNMRDYNSPVDWIAARTQHAQRVDLIRRVGGYYLQLAQAVMRKVA